MHITWLHKGGRREDGRGRRERSGERERGPPAVAIEPTCVLLAAQPSCQKCCKRQTCDNQRTSQRLFKEARQFANIGAKDKSGSVCDDRLLSMDPMQLRREGFKDQQFARSTFAGCPLGATHIFRFCQIRGWKLFCFVARTMLHRPRRGGARRGCPPLATLTSS